MPTVFSCPFECKEYGQDVDYKAHMLPKTDDILARTVNISIGITDDPHTGLDFGINIFSKDTEIEMVGKKIKESVLQAV